MSLLFVIAVLMVTWFEEGFAKSHDTPCALGWCHITHHVRCNDVTLHTVVMLPYDTPCALWWCHKTYHGPNLWKLCGIFLIIIERSFKYNGVLHLILLWQSYTIIEILNNNCTVKVLEIAFFIHSNVLMWLHYNYITEKGIFLNRAPFT